MKKNMLLLLSTFNVVFMQLKESKTSSNLAKLIKSFRESQNYLRLIILIVIIKLNDIKFKNRRKKAPSHLNNFLDTALAKIVSGQYS